MPKPHPYRVLVQKLRAHDERFVINVRRGKGSERMIYHPDIDGRAAAYPVTCHNEGHEIGKGMLKAIIRRFNLPDDFFD